MLRLLYFLLLLFPFTIFSQEKANALLKSAMNDDLNIQEWHVLVEGNIEKIMQHAEEWGITVKYHAGNVASVIAGKDALARMLQQKFIQHIEYSNTHGQPMNDTMLVKNRIKEVKQGAVPLAQAYNGSGVIVGIMDTGIDFNHPDFKLSNGNTRIQFIWDQGAASGSATPTPYNYGWEWTAAQINASLCTHSDMAYNGHGTHVSGIAAGNGMATGTHEGIASEADIIMVAVKFNAPQPIYSDGVNYILSKAQALGKPCVINASIGNYIGSHDATDLQAKLIANMLTALPGRAMVAAAGNAGNSKFHVKTPVVLPDTSFTWLRRASGNIHYFVYADTLQIKNVEMSIGVNNPAFHDLGRIPFHDYQYGLSGLKIDTLKHNNNRIGIIRTSASINTSGVYEKYYQIIPDSANYYWRVESHGTGLHDAWNFDLVSSGLPALAQYTNMAYYVMPDTLSTIVTGFQCSDEVITVGNYINLNSYFDVNNTLQTTPEVPGKIKENSSSGPTRDNRIKPEVAATGANVFSAMALGMQANLVTNFPQVVAQGSFHVQGGGTSAASPVVAGLAALFLEAYPGATNKNVRDAIKNCTYTDGFTGTIPNHVFGYGKLDGKAAMLCTVFTGTPKWFVNNNNKAYPNPFSGSTTLEFEQNIHGTIFLYDATGKLLFQEEVQGNQYTLHKTQLGNYSGLVLAKVNTANEIFSFKLICN